MRIALIGSTQYMEQKTFKDVMESYEKEKI